MEFHVTRLCFKMSVVGLGFGFGGVPKLCGNKVTLAETRFNFGASGITVNANAHLVTKSDKWVRDAVDSVFGISVSGVLCEIQTDWKTMCCTLQQLFHRWVGIIGRQA